MKPERRRPHAEEVPKWEALFAELGPTGVLGSAPSSTSLDREDKVPPRRRDARDRQPLRGDEGADRRRDGLETEDLDAAIAIAARIPVVFRASVELRPVIEH